MEKIILLVDDESDIREVLNLALTDLGYTVYEAESGGQALRLFKDVQPAIVLTDIKMPGKDGFAVLRKIKAIAPQTDVIVITGHGDKDLARQALDMDASAFFNKPLDTEALEKAIDEIRARLDSRRLTREST